MRNRDPCEHWRQGHTSDSLAMSARARAQGHVRNKESTFGRDRRVAHREVGLWMCLRESIGQESDEGGKGRVMERDEEEEREERGKKRKKKRERDLSPTLWHNLIKSKRKVPFPLIPLREGILPVDQHTFFRCHQSLATALLLSPTSCPPRPHAARRNE